MSVDVSLEGGDVAQARIARMIANTQHLEPALLRAGLVPLKAAQERIDAGGPGWAPNVTHTPLLHQTGRLLSSLTVGSAGEVQRVTSDEIVVGTNVPYATWIQGGTGIFGPSGSPIAPKNSSAFVFNIGGHKIFARSIKGMPARRFLFIDEKIAETVRRIFAKHVFGADIHEVAEMPL